MSSPTVWGRCAINDDQQAQSRGGLSRRTFLQAAAGTALVGASGALGWTPLFRIPAASAQSTIPSPPGFPSLTDPRPWFALSVRRLGVTTLGRRR
jgi:hypothetical protein